MWRDPSFPPCAQDLSSALCCPHQHKEAPTWIFMATSRPPFMRARCTCPMEAAAKGRSSKYSSLSRQLGPKSLLRVFWNKGQEGAVSTA